MPLPNKFWASWTPVTVDITKWSKFLTVRAAGKLYQALAIPPFSVSPLPWLGASYITTKFNVSLAKKFSLVLPIVPPPGVNFCLAVMWATGAAPDYDVHRYKLWQGVGEDLDYPLYAGETINKDFTLEVWNTTGSDTTSLTLPYILLTSLLSDPANCCATYEESLIDELCGIFAQLPMTYGNPLVFSNCFNTFMNDGIGFMNIQPDGETPEFIVR